MSRNLFGTWGLGLSARDFACAIAALGVREAAAAGAVNGSTSGRATVKQALDETDRESRIPWRIHTPLLELAGVGGVRAAEGFGPEALLHAKLECGFRVLDDF